MDNDDRWPCYKRVAHGPHVIDSAMESIRLTRKQLTELVMLSERGALWCPGLKAHWDTMIGRTNG